jgi:hypothetical protein
MCDMCQSFELSDAAINEVGAIIKEATKSPLPASAVAEILKGSGRKAFIHSCIEYHKWMHKWEIPL